MSSQATFKNFESECKHIYFCATTIPILFLSILIAIYKLMRRHKNSMEPYSGRYRCYLIYIEN